MKNSLKDLNRRFELAEKQISKLKDRSTEIIHSVNSKSLERNKQGLRDIWDVYA